MRRHGARSINPSSCPQPQQASAPIKIYFCIGDFQILLAPTFADSASRPSRRSTHSYPQLYVVHTVPQSTGLGESPKIG
jgi:hypothetical protein